MRAAVSARSVPCRPLHNFVLAFIVAKYCHFERNKWKRRLRHYRQQVSRLFAWLRVNVMPTSDGTCCQMKKSTTTEDEQIRKKRCLDLLERYIYLILFNTYLHCDRHNKWQRSFSSWMSEVRFTDSTFSVH